ncbi:MAG: cupin domain-containing protein [Alphaproteobacteria bacterium]
MTDATAAKRAELTQDAKSLHLTEFWRERADIELMAPRHVVQAHVWHWKDIEPRLHQAAKIVPIEECERRALVFSNPGIKDKPYMTNTIFGAYSLYNPGEQAPVHRHTPSASRFVLEGDGGFTTVEGEKCTMARGDLILTPTGTWHDHGNDGNDPVIWMDVLNVPLVESLNATIFEFNYTEKEPGSNSGDGVPRKVQSIREPSDHSTNLYGTGGLVPLFVSHQRGTTVHSPKFVYRWSETRRALERLRDYAGSPYDGIIMEYTDPATGQSVMPSMSYRSQMLRPGEHTKAHRHMSSTAYCVLEGNGYTLVGDKRLDWGRNDVFVVPSWQWHEHVNLDTRAPTFLYSVTDEPTLRKLSLFREQGRDADGTIVAIA